MNNSIYKKGLAVVLIIALIVMASLGIKQSGKENEIMYTSSEMTNSDTVLESAEEELSCIYVDIDGAVNNPGVYEFTEGDRVIDAIEKAGGLIDTAYTKNLNKARKLVDGEKIYIFDEGENIAPLDLYNDGNEGKININTASKDNLMSLTGIGEVYAQRIIDYRSLKVFSSIEEIKEVQGIGDKIFEKIKDSITIK